MARKFAIFVHADKAQLARIGEQPPPELQEHLHRLRRLF